MPIIHIYSKQSQAPNGLLRELCQEVTRAMSIPSDKAWAMWHGLEVGNYWRPDWETAGDNPGPLVTILCQQKHSSENVARMMECVRTRLATALGCRPEAVFVAVQRVAPTEVLELPPS